MMDQGGVSEAGGHVFVAKTPEAFVHDDDGNLLSDGRWAYTWDGENRLVSMTTHASVPPLAHRRLVFAYDHMSRRATKHEFTRNPATGALDAPAGESAYASDGWTLAAEFTPSTGAAVRRYMWNPSGRGGHRSLAAVRLGGGTGASASPPAQFAVVDANANVSLLLNGASGAASAGGGAPEMSAVYEYGPFGEPLRATGPLAKANPVRFSSELLDTATGCYYYGYRTYNPDTGRWLSRDPIGELGGVNLYILCGNVPFGLRDLLGLDWLHDTANFVAGMGDSLTFGLTREARILLNSVIYKSADDAGVDPNSGFYFAGEAAETTVEIIVTAGGAGLRHVAKHTVRKAYLERPAKKAFRKAHNLSGGIIHHINPVKGHPDFTRARYPLPFKWASQGQWNFKWVPDRAAHMAQHRRLIRLEAIDRLRESTLLVRQAANRLAVAASPSPSCPASVYVRATVEASALEPETPRRELLPARTSYPFETVTLFESGMMYWPEE